MFSLMKDWRIEESGFSQDCFWEPVLSVIGSLVIMQNET